MWDKNGKSIMNELRQRLLAGEWIGLGEAKPPFDNEVDLARIEDGVVVGNCVGYNECCPPKMALSGCDTLADKWEYYTTTWNKEK